MQKRGIWKSSVGIRCEKVVESVNIVSRRSNVGNFWVSVWVGEICGDVSNFAGRAIFVVVKNVFA